MSYVILRVFNFTDLTLQRWALSRSFDNIPVPNANTLSALKIGLLLFFLTHSLKKSFKNYSPMIKEFWESRGQVSDCEDTHQIKLS